MVGHGAVGFRENRPIGVAKDIEVVDQLRVALDIEALNGCADGGGPDVGRTRAKRGGQHRQHRAIARAGENLASFFQGAQGSY